MGTNSTDLVRKEEAPPAPADYGVARSNAMGGEVATTAETSTSQLEAQARALIQARFFLAKQPHMQRSWDQVEQRLRKECARPGFANSAWWILPLGSDPKKYPKGLSIRFAEAALRLSGNIDVQTQTVFDDDWKRIVRVTVLDLETNFAYSNEITVEKTVERRHANDRQVMSYRQNSEGKMTYIVAATEQELALKQGSAVSKAIRTLGLRLIPGDILDECRALIESTRAKGAAAEDPELARKAILDNFSELGVMPADLARYLEHDTSMFQPAERDLLRGVYSAIKNGMATWKEVMEAKFGAGEGTEESEGAKRIKEALAKRKPAPVPKDPPPTPSQAEPQPTAGTSQPQTSGPITQADIDKAEAELHAKKAAETEAYPTWEAFDAAAEKYWNETQKQYRPARVVVAGKVCVLSPDGDTYAEEAAPASAVQSEPKPEFGKPAQKRGR